MIICNSNSNGQYVAPSNQRKGFLKTMKYLLLSPNSMAQCSSLPLFLHLLCEKILTHSILILIKSNLVLEVGLQEFWVPPHLYRQHPVFVTSSQKHVWKFNAWKSNKRLTCYKGDSVPRELKKYDKKTLIMSPLLDTIWYISILLYMSFHHLFFQNSHKHTTDIQLVSIWG